MKTDANAALPASADKAQVVEDMFDRIAPRYDLLNRVLSVGTDVRWRRRAVDFLELAPPLRVLDLCTGTADLLLEAVSRHPGSSGLGVDLAQGMLLRGAAKLARRGLAQTPWPSPPHARGVVRVSRARRTATVPPGSSVCERQAWRRPVGSAG